MSGSSRRATSPRRERRRCESRCGRSRRPRVRTAPPAPPAPPALPQYLDAAAALAPQVFQDVAFPIGRLVEAVALCEKLFHIFPLLCYPCRVTDHPGRLVRAHPRGKGTAAFANLGVYGVPAPIVAGDRAFKTISAVRELEAWIRGAGGFQHSYCDSFLSRDEWAQMFDAAHYEAMRKRYGADGRFVHSFEKTRPEVDIWAWLEEERSWA